MLAYSSDRQIIIVVALIIISVGIPIIINYYKRNKSVKSKNELVKENKFVLENKKNIEKKLDDIANELKVKRTRTFIVLLLLLISIGLMFIVEQRIIMMIIMIVLSIIFGIFYYDYSKLSTEKFNEVVQSILKEYDNDLDYQPNRGFTKGEYYTCLFPETCDRFSSEDLIVNSKKGFCYSDILVESKHEDDEGHTHYTTEFEGSLARMDIEDVKCRIFLGSTQRNYVFKSNGLTNINFENEEFNKLFRACSDNELLAYKILTPDIMEEFVKIKKNTYGDIDIRIINDKLYVRFLSGDTFDSVLFSKKAEKESLLQSIAVLEEVMKTMEKVKKIINDKNNE